MATTQLKDKNGGNVYPTIEEGSGSGNSNINFTSELVYDYSLLLDRGTRFINNNGAVETTSPNFATYNNWQHTDYLPIVGNTMTVTYNVPSYLSNAGYNPCYAFYDSGKNFITDKAFLCKNASSGVTHDFSEWSTKPAYVRFSGCSVHPEGGAAEFQKARAWFRAVQTVSGAEAIPLAIENAKHKTYRILAFGNSFTVDTFNNMASLCARLGVTNVVIQFVAKSSGTLGEYANIISSESDVETATNGTFYTAVGCCDVYPVGTMAEVLAHDWDMVFFQQQSTASINYTDSNDTSLTALINAVKTYCTNPFVRIGWLFTWETWQGSGTTICFPYSSISAAVQKMHKLHPDVIVVPAGTAIQNARGTTLNMDGNTIIGGMLSSDYQEKSGGGINWYQHLAGGAGEYIAAYTFFEKILAPITGKSFLLDDIVTSGSGTGVVNITDNNRAVVQNCVLAALKNPWEVTDPSELDPNYVAPTT